VFIGTAGICYGGFRVGTFGVFCDKTGDKCLSHSILIHEDLNDLYSSPTILPVIKSRKIRWTGM
jgi:hypothetical protein